jgi:amidase
MASILDRDKLNAFCRHTHVEVAGAPQGPLAGLTFGLKDLYDVGGHKTGFGSPAWLETHPPAARTAPAVELLLNAGAAIIGKTHTDELAFSLNGNNAHYGRPINVNAPGRLAGGSSSGSAAATAGKLCDFALGSDTGGSVRLPASFCGLYGIRATHGRIPLDGACPLAPSFDTAGWFARDMDMFAKVGKILLASEKPGANPDRILMAEDAFALLAPDVNTALQPALGRVQTTLGAAQSVTVAAEGLRQWFEVFRIIQFFEIWQTHGGWITNTNPRLGPGIKERLDVASRLDPAEVAKAQAAREDITKRMAALLGGRNILVLPTVPGIAPLADTPVAELEDFRGRAMSLLCIAGLARLPQITLPLAKHADCPLGLSLIGPSGGDEMLIAAAARIAAAA